MSMTDPIADMFTRIRNAQRGEKRSVSVPASKLKRAILEVLRQEGYIEGFKEQKQDGHAMLEVGLKYYAGFPVIERIERVSKSGCREYRKHEELEANRVDAGLGVAILSTSKGIMTDRAARKAGLGGELLGIIS